MQRLDGDAHRLYAAVGYGAGPAAIINRNIEPVTAVGAIIVEIPAVGAVTHDPAAAIRTGDFVEVNGATGEIHIPRGVGTPFEKQEKNKLKEDLL